METTFSALLAAYESSCARHAQSPASQAVAAGTTARPHTRCLTLALDADCDPLIGAHIALVTEDSCTVAGTRDWAHVSTATTSLYTGPVQCSSAARAGYFGSRRVLRSLSFLRTDSSATRVVLPRDLSFGGAGAFADDLAADFGGGARRIQTHGANLAVPPGQARAAAAANVPFLALASSPEPLLDPEVHAGYHGHGHGQVSRAVRCIPRRSRSQVILRGWEEPTSNNSSGPQLLSVQRRYSHRVGAGQQLGQGQEQATPRPAPLVHGWTSCTAPATGASGGALRGGAPRGDSLAVDAVDLGPAVPPPVLPPPPPQQQLVLPQEQGQGNWSVAQAEGCPPTLLPNPHASRGGDPSCYEHLLSEAAIASAGGEGDWGCMRTAELESSLPIGWL